MTVSSVSRPHARLDVGAFVYEWGGVRWVEQPGGENYGLPGYFGPQRWTYFRNSTLGQSTLAFCTQNDCGDSGPNPNQLPVGTLLAYNQGNNAYGLISNMSSTLPQGTLDAQLYAVNRAIAFWKRSISLTTGPFGPRTSLVIEDVFAGNENNCQFEWSVQTESDAVVTGSGEAVELSNAARKVRLSLEANLPATAGSASSSSKFSVESISLEKPQYSSAALKRIVYKGGCVGLLPGAKRTVRIRIDPVQ